MCLVKHIWIIFKLINFICSDASSMATASASSSSPSTTTCMSCSPFASAAVSTTIIFVISKFSSFHNWMTICTCSGGTQVWNLTDNFLQKIKHIEALHTLF
uniref:Uncharacterized protein n=1 Tax=Opuntia streptacantha TaxID=393608 RepID=A0A7C9D5K5_OPUST